MAEERQCTEIPVGPFHPLLDAPGVLRIKAEGEKAAVFNIDISSRHRGIEKLSETMHFNQAVSLTERICGICSAAHSFAYVNAVEDLAGIKIPERAGYVRAAAGELERIQAHLLWLGLTGNFIGFDTLWMRSSRLRGRILDICGKVFGNRLNYAVMKIGGVRRDISGEQGRVIRKALDSLLPGIDKLQNFIEADPVIKSRLKNAGRLTREQVLDYCALGPAARASGVDIDIRRDAPYAAYHALDFKVPVRKEGDIYARAVIRLEEIRQSAFIIIQCVNILDKTKPVTGTDISEIPSGEGIGRCESPSGEVFHYVRSYGGTVPYRHKIRGASYMNLAAVEASVKGGELPDAAYPARGIRGHI